MLDQMTMPVLFAVLIVALAVVSVGVFVAIRVVAARSGAGDVAPAAPYSQPSPSDGAASRAAVDPTRNRHSPELE